MEQVIPGAIQTDAYFQTQLIAKRKKAAQAPIQQLGLHPFPFLSHFLDAVAVRIRGDDHVSFLGSCECASWAFLA